MSSQKTKSKVKLTRYLKPYLLFTIISPIFMVGEVMIDLMQPKLMSKIVNNGVLGNDMGVIISTGIQMLILVAFGGFMGIMCAWTASVASQGFGNDVRVEAFDRVMHLSLEQTDKFTTGSLVTRLTNDITTLQDFVAMVLRMFVRAPISLIGGLIMCLSLNVNFGYVMIFSIPVMLVVCGVILFKANPMFSAVQKKLDKVNSVVQENVSGARVIKAYTREDYEINRFGEANTDFKNTSMRVLKLMASIGPILMIVMNLSTLAIIYIGGLQIEAKAMNVGDVMAATTYITNVLMSIMMVSMMAQQISRGKASADRVKAVLEANPVIISGTNDTGISQGTVEFKKVNFRYPGTHGNNVLSDINLKVNKGETIAIIGSTGSGKSSLVNLITRFYDADSGEVIVDGVNVRDWDIEQLRKKIGFVLQKSELFSGTVADNIRWGRPDATDEEIKKVAEIAQADEFISSFTDGYNTIIAEKGTSLSGGQKQRVSIARAVIRKPEIIIFDDSTSALDLGTEAKLQKSLRENLKGTTIIIIAQRIASIMSADKIAVIENGTITAFDNHENLMKTSATYRDIYSSQMKSNENGGVING